jgi:CBS domain-containing protein
MRVRVREIMTPNPISLDADATATEAASLMRTHDLGDVLVTRGRELCGVVTDRDLVVRGLATEGDVRSKRLSDLCTPNVATISPEESVDDAVALMKRHAVRRLPVVEHGEPIGIVTLGDLARRKEPRSALGSISEASPNR